ncbi:MAG: ureidoglycolate lyase [bacterium]
MRKAKIERLTRDAFAPFGCFANLIDPKWDKIGEKPVEFYRDMVQLDLGGATSASFSVCRVEKRPEVVDVTEFHTSTGEAILPLDNDILIHVAPATPKGVVPHKDIRIFAVPRGTVVVLKPGVWHHAPILDGGEAANVLIVLPERTYANDCEVVELKEQERVAVER